MKKILTVLFAVSVASSAMAAGNLSVDFGSVWYKVSYTDGVSDHLQGQGQSFAINWTLDNDLSLGAYSESGRWVYASTGYDDWDIRAITIAKGIVKNVTIGMNLGDMYDTYSGDDGMLTDIFGSVVILGGSGDKVSGQLKTNVGARFIVNDSDYNMSGITVSLSVGLLF